jgi:hypothetical protein
MNLNDLISSFKPSFDPLPLAEKILARLAATAGILLLGWALRYLPTGIPLIILGSSAAAAVLLYAVPHSPKAQPWPVVGGNLLSGLVGWTCGMLIPDPVLAGALRSRPGRIPDAFAALSASPGRSDRIDHGAGGRAVSSAWLGLDCLRGVYQYHAGAGRQQSDSRQKLSDAQGRHAASRGGQLGARAG